MAAKMTQLKIEIEQLKRLLDDPQPGLVTWMTMMSNRMKAVRDLIDDYFGDERREYVREVVKGLERRTPTEHNR